MSPIELVTATLSLLPVVAAVAAPSPDPALTVVPEEAADVRAEREAREALRAKSNLRLVEKSDEGSAHHSLGDGIYGFTYSPRLDLTPVFRKGSFQTFEVHHTAGVAHLVGFVEPEQAEQDRVHRSLDQVVLYPSPFGEAKTLVSIPFPRISRMKPPRRENGGAIDLTLERE